MDKQQKGGKHKPGLSQAQPQQNFLKLIANKQQHQSSQQQIQESQVLSNHDRNQSTSPSVKQAMYDTDMQYFESMISQYQDELGTSLMQKRFSISRNDPLEEIQDLYSEIKDQENKFKKVLDVCVFMMDKNKELFLENESLTHQADQTIQRLTYLEDQNHILIAESRRYLEQNEIAKDHMKELEEMMSELREEIDQKNQMLDEFERNFNESRVSERMTMNSQVLITPQDLAELKKSLQERNYQIKELDQVLNQQTIKYEMEQKKSNLLSKEIKKLKETNKELSFQIDEFNEILEEKDMIIEECELQIKQLEEELTKKQMHQYNRSMTKNNQQLMNPLAKTQVDMIKGNDKNRKSFKDKKDSKRIDHGSKYQRRNIKGKESLYQKNGIIEDQIEKHIAVKSQMEDYRQIKHHRKGSMPLVIIDKTNTKFRIYDKKFKVQQDMKENVNGINGEKKRSSDDRKVAPPPEYYPFNELERVVEEAQVKLRVPSSLRYQTEYLQSKGHHFQSILNRQRITGEVSEKDEFDDEEQQSSEEFDYEEDQDQFVETVLHKQQTKNNHETFRPVSILDQGLEINEEDFMYDNNNLRATINMDPYNNPHASYLRSTLARDHYDSSSDKHGSIQYDNAIIAESESNQSPEYTLERESLFQKSYRNSTNNFSLVKPSQSNQKIQETIQISENKKHEDQQQEDQNILRSTIRNQKSHFKKRELEILTEENNGVNQSIEKDSPDNFQSIETPSFQQVSGNANFRQTFNNPDSNEKLRISGIKGQVFSEEESIKKQSSQQQRSHQKKLTDSTAAGNSNQRISPNAQQVPQEDFRSNIQVESIVSNAQSIQDIGGSYQPFHSQSQILSSEELALVHHQRGYSSNMPPQQIKKEGQKSPVQDNKTQTNSRGPESSYGGRGSASGGSGPKSPSHLARKDPDEEFFMMTLLSYKLNHKEIERILNVNNIYISVITIIQTDPNYLYTLARSEKVTFNSFQKWIETKLERLYLEHMYKRKLRIIEANKPGVKEQKSVKFAEINIENNYF